LHDPYLLAGTAVPDWLGLVQRDVRVTEAAVRPWTGHADPLLRATAAGMLLHLEDDRWFHSAPAFLELCRQFAGAIRRRLADSEQLRPSFAAHVAIEMLLDGVLESEIPGLVDTYYQTLALVDPHTLEQLVGRVCGRPLATLAPHLERFQGWRFLGDYNDDERLRVRLNQVLSRVDLPPLPPAFSGLLPDMRAVVRLRQRELLPRGRAR
jgi:hypothetical protein